MNYWKPVGLAALVLALFAWPLVNNDAGILSVFFFTLVFIGMSVSWNIIGGYAGYVSLGHAVFFGVGAYTMALLGHSLHLANFNLFWLVLVGGLFAGIVAVAVGWVALRLRTIHSFVIITIAFMFLFQLAAGNLSFTGGSVGVGVPQPANWSAAFFTIPFYYLGLALCILTVLLSWWIRGTRFGLGLLAIRDDEDKAAGIGVDTWRYKMTAYVISAIPVGMFGALYGYYVSYLYPSLVFDPNVDLQIVLGAFLGGMGTVAGPVIGAAILNPAQQILAIVTGQSGIDLILFGVLFIFVLIFMPIGIWPSLERALSRRSTDLVTEVGTQLDRGQTSHAGSGGMDG